MPASSNLERRRVEEWGHAWIKAFLNLLQGGAACVKVGLGDFQSTRRLLWVRK